MEQRIHQWVKEYLPTIEMDPPHAITLVGLFDPETASFNEKVGHAAKNFSSVFQVHVIEALYEMIQVLVYEELWRRCYDHEGVVVETRKVVEETHGFHLALTSTVYAIRKLLKIIATNPVEQESPPTLGLRDCYKKSGFKINTVPHIYNYIQERLAASGQK